MATLHELQTIYTCVDVYDMLEMIDVHSTITEVQHKEQMAKVNAAGK